MGVGKKLLAAAKPVWFVVVAGATITVYSGQAEPYVSPSALPEGPAFMFGSAAAVLIAGWLVIAALESTVGQRGWVQAGRKAGFTPESSGLAGRPDLTGTIQGRTVRARTITRKGASHAEGGTNKQTLTIVEAELASPCEAGLVLAPADDGSIRAGSTKLSLEADALAAAEADLTVVEDGSMTVLSDDEALVEAVRSSSGASTVRGLDGVTVYAGDAAGLFSQALEVPEAEASGLGGWIQGKMADKAEEAIVDRIPADASTVSLEAQGLVLDGSRLRRQAEAVAAIADAVDEAPSSRPAGSQG